MMSDEIITGIMVTAATLVLALATFAAKQARKSKTIKQTHKGDGDNVGGDKTDITQMNSGGTNYAADTMNFTSAGERPHDELRAKK